MLHSATLQFESYKITDALFTQMYINHAIITFVVHERSPSSDYSPSSISKLNSFSLNSQAKLQWYIGRFLESCSKANIRSRGKLFESLGVFLRCKRIGVECDVPRL